MQVQGDLTMFAFMTHTHGLGSNISGYIRHKGHDNEFARGDPQKPQTFHQMEHLPAIREVKIVNTVVAYQERLNSRIYTRMKRCLTL